MSYLKVDTREFKEAQKLLEAAGKNINKVVIRALNRTVSMAKTEQNKLIRQGYNAPAKILKSKISLGKAKPNLLEALVYNSSSRIPLENFKVNKANPGHYKEKIKVSVKKGSLRVLEGGFWANYKNNQSRMGLHKRSGEGRDTLERLYGPSSYQMGTNKQILEKLEKSSIENFSKRFNHEFLRELGIK